ncbi:MAG: hypothetical protein KBC84_03145 [Proteobacteria bacterium]|nr:hypothetical protein [Pseudomonadota bacterium]
MNIEELIKNFSLESSLELVTNSPPWWLIAFLVLVPLFMFLGAREFLCWFWKFNSIASSLNKISSHLNELNNKLDILEKKIDTKTNEEKTVSMQIKQDF